MTARKKSSINSLFIKVANEGRLNLQLEDVVLVIVGCFIVLQTGPDIKHHG